MLRYLDLSELENFKRNRLWKDISPANNILYFPNNLDIRICPKNGMTTLKEALKRCIGRLDYEGDKHDTGTISFRLNQIKKHSYGPEQPFRKGSTRIAVKRDPVERFTSACEYLARKREKFVKHGINYPELKKDLRSVISEVMDGSVKNEHFFSQSYFMGNIYDYDLVYDLDDLTKLLDFLSTSTGNALGSIWENKTPRNKLYDDILTESDVRDIMRLYEKDYDNGWH